MLRNPEFIHKIFLNIFFIIQKTFLIRFLRFIVKKYNKNNYFEKKGIVFKNKIGIAAGFDKNAKCINTLESLGFGFIEIGSVTLFSRKGNSKPRIFKNYKNRTIINNLGLPNIGVEKIKKRLKKLNTSIPIGINIAIDISKNNKISHFEFIKCYEELNDYGDYFVINISCPNIGYKIDEVKVYCFLKKIRKLINSFNKKPILIKISQNTENYSFSYILYIIKYFGFDGIVINNTIQSKKGIKGGLSGPPLHYKKILMIDYARRFLGSKFLIIGVGGIDSIEKARETIEAGADVIQIYTGFVYKGPKLIYKINKNI
jgi:dihydroorotate dehydrogenase